MCNTFYFKIQIQNKVAVMSQCPLAFLNCIQCECTMCTALFGMKLLSLELSAQLQLISLQCSQCYRQLYLYNTLRNTKHYNDVQHKASSHQLDGEEQLYINESSHLHVLAGFKCPSVQITLSKVNVTPAGGQLL